MYLHLGSNQVVYSEDVIGIFDIALTRDDCFRELLTVTQITRLPGRAKSVVITKKQAIFAPVSRSTLLRRWRKNRYSYMQMLLNE